LAVGSSKYDKLRTDELKAQVTMVTTEMRKGLVGGEVKEEKASDRIKFVIKELSKVLLQIEQMIDGKFLDKPLSK